MTLIMMLMGEIVLLITIIIHFGMVAVGVATSLLEEAMLIVLIGTVRAAVIHVNMAQYT